MKFEALLIILSLAFLGSCNTGPKVITSDSYSEEDKIITIVFDTVIGPDSNWRKHRLLPLKMYLNTTPPDVKAPKESNKQLKADTEEYLRFADSVRKRLDTAKLYVFIQDSLICFPTFEKTEASATIKSGGFSENLPDTDLAFDKLVSKLFDSIKPRKFNISEIASKYHYYIEYKKNNIEYSRDDTVPSKIVKIGTLTFSRVVINKDTTKAILFMDMRHEGASLFYLNKVKGNWKVTKRNWLWVY